MSRHRNIRNLRVEDYIDEDFYDDYDERDYDENDYEKHDANGNDDDNSLIHHLSQPSAHTNASPLDEGLLDDLLHQFRHVLSDETLTTAELDAALSAVDYDWEKALSLLRARKPTAARQADPSPIAKLLSSDHHDPHVPMPSQAAPSLDYDAFVQQIGTALPTASTHPQPAPYRFDQPSPDDVIRAKQSGGQGPSGPTLRLPKPSAPRRPSAPAPVSPSKSKPSKPTALRVKPIRAPPKATDPPKRPNKPSQPQAAIKQRVKPVDLKHRMSSTSPSLAVVVAGHVDAGKSTLIGHLLEQLNPSSRRKPADLAWATDEDPVERERGVTIDIASRTVVRPGNPSRTIALIDSPGHRDFVPAMILGAAQAAAALLIVDASPGEFEAGFQEHGQTREHALVLLAFGVTSLIVVINKMDVVEYSQPRYDEIRKAVGGFLRANGWKTNSSLSFLPVSGREGVNLVSGPKSGHPLCTWYSGRTLIQELDGLNDLSKKDIEVESRRPTRLVVTDFFRSASLGGQAAVTGRLLCGSVAPRDRLFSIPGSSLVTVKSAMVGAGDRVPVAVAGLDAAPISLGLTDLPDGAMLAPGTVLCDPIKPAIAAKVVRTRLLVTAKDALVVRGDKGILHVAGAAEAVSVIKLCEYVTKNASQKGAKKRAPRRLVRGDKAVVDIECERAVAMEKKDGVKALGRVAFRQEGRTVAVGIVLEILKAEKVEDEAEDDSVV